MRVGDTLITLVLLYFIICLMYGQQTKIRFGIIFAISLFIYYIIVSICIGYIKVYHKYPCQFKCDRRVVVSLSTLPSRLGGIKPVLDSILNGTVVPDAIYLNLPKYSKRERKEYVITEELKNTGGDRLIINSISEDYGPATKLYPTLLKETDPETIIICIDDDIKYDPKLVETLLAASDQFPDSCVCLKGWSFFNMGFMSIPIYFPYFFVKKVDILQCYGGVLYKVKFFKELDKFRKYMDLKPCFTTDDIMISKFLTNVGVYIIMVPHRLKNIELKSQAKSKLSDFNTNNNQWIKCINATLWN